MEAKLYYTISEVADMFNVNQSLIRFWETEFPKQIKPKRNKRGVRFFTQDDIDNIKNIYHLVKEKKYTLDGAKEELKKKKLRPAAEKDVMPPTKEANNQFDLFADDKQMEQIKYNHRQVYDKLMKIKEIAEELYNRD
ncbi:MAG: MerR family transcriptional regulator [Bacteroidales bacterium]|jgi:DNA-binding transcriptional MerR regulator|nr:MerR family transcriptional regulator [Bacteroidales bacterium]MDD2203972.1 MerR family transcriptional regulator [Bacteroidales bacterium]MDD3153202.1 MerR family transcriptional regulator [Bacteroidales bacterium]MDD3913439.1 MerR family transcriptional regulator [Bacteroidales bacterium]MDD4633235.1 MerR family transcriptional regulator [Bacteroidales bacterium]